MPSTFETILILDFGSQYTQLIGRRIREANVYSEILPFSASIETILQHRPKGIVLSGGPDSVYEPGAPASDPRLFELGVPILGVCDDLRTWRQLALVWGVLPVLFQDEPGYEAMLDCARRYLFEHKLAQPGQRVVVTAGVPFHVSGTTNMLRVEEL